MRIIYFCLLLYLISGCATKKIVDASPLKDIVMAQDFSVESDRALPMASSSLNRLQNSGILGVGNSANHISLIGNPNFFKMKGDSITSYLPYFGERHMGGGYSGDDIAIQFDGLVDEYDAEWDAKKQQYNIGFKAKSKGESFEVRLVLFPNLNSFLTILGTQRSSIIYTGKVMANAEK
ncbi:DUF4251 domain-containing protein [Cellulophaga sp. F20128]|uniref:DUF4251 domain-containing protein n=1 Tax=Cellulophaga sp. F20128 TaxID=2926413 RepID=UPI001FF39E15|nr:DUF4251 domain-containing protein [Cellulophaga sp. F20128]MCK0156270.1 DUF4251 domain-containing protein [Cellulophaga sp. F20128]